MYLVSTTSTPKFFFEFYVLLQMHARGTLELEKSAMHHHNYYISHHDRRPLLIRPSYSIQVYCNSSTPCCTHTILRRKLYTLLGALVIGASRLSAFSESLALKSLWVNSSEQSHIIFSSLKQARARTKIISGMSDRTHVICNLYPHTLPSSYLYLQPSSISNLLDSGRQVFFSIYLVYVCPFSPSAFQTSRYNLTFWMSKPTVGPLVFQPSFGLKTQ